MRTEVLSSEQARRIIERLAHEVLERHRGADTLSIVGIRRRGTVLAEALAQAIGRVAERELLTSDLDVTPYRDDREHDGAKDQSVLRATIADRDVILVDDVLYTGRTVRAALDALVQHGRPRSIQLVALIDRGHREYPIRPDFVGRRIPTKARERVVVDVEGGFTVAVEE